MAEVINAIEGQWRDAVMRWQQKVAEFQTAIEAHYANRYKAEALGPEELARWQSQLDHALQVKTAIEILQEAIASTSTWARSTFGLSGLRAMASQLGFIPLVPVAVIVGSISTVTAVIYALYSYNTQLEKKWAYINSRPDLTADEVANILDSGVDVPTPFTSDAKDIVVWIVIGGALLMFGPKLLERFNK